MIYQCCICGRYTRLKDCCLEDRATKSIKRGVDSPDDSIPSENNDG
jgi:hypothetical protein